MTKRSAFEDGDSSSQLCFIAEAPSSVEIRLNQPLVGPSGGIFNKGLQDAGIVRSDCYILNVFEEQVFKDKGDNVIMDRDRNVLWSARNGFTQLGRELSKRTTERLKASKANCFVPLGAVAFSLLYGNQQILKWRGSILWSEQFKRKFVPTVHPAFIMRGQPLYQYPFVHDLERAAAEAKSPELSLPKRSIWTDPTFQEAIQYIKLCGKKKQVGFDIECLNRHVSCFALAMAPDNAISIPMIGMRAGSDRWTEEEEEKIWLALADLLANEKVEKVGHNLVFDTTFMWQQNSIRTRGPIGDTYLAQSIMYPGFPKKLAYATSIYTREPYYKDDGKLWSKPWIDMERFWRYNALDAAVSLEIWQTIKKEIKDEGFQWTYDSTVELFEPLQYMMIHGIKLDTNGLAKAKAEAEQLVAAKEQELHSVAEWEFNPGSPAQCAKYFYVTKGIKPYVSIHTGRMTTDDKAMARIYRRYNLREAKLVQEIRGIRKQISNYLDVVYDTDNRVRCSYDPRGTWSGRLSSSETIFGTGLNFQNLDPMFKDFLVADEI